MTVSVAGTETEQGATDSGRVPQSPDNGVRHLAREQYPRLYYQITHEHVSFDHIAKAWGISHNPDKPTKEENPDKSIQNKSAKNDEKRISQFLEMKARRKFSKEHGDIEREYWSEEPLAGCALTGDGCVHSVMNSADPELVLYEAAVHQLCRDARRAFETAVGQAKKAAGRQDKKADRNLKEIGEMLYVVLARMIVAASVLEKEKATQREKDDAFASLRAEWKTACANVKEMIQRQARFEYFEGIGLGALITIPILAWAGYAAVHYGINQFSEPGEPGSFTAAIIGGAAGAVISVTQRMTTNSLMLDFTAPKWQKKALGMLRPLVGAVFGAVVYFALVGGLVAVHAKTGKDASVALAFFAVAGFASGFSERFASDVLERAGSGIVPTNRSRQDTEKPDELFLLLSQQLPRHEATPRPHREEQATSATKDRKGETGPAPAGHAA